MGEGAPWQAQPTGGLSSQLNPSPCPVRHSKVKRGSKMMQRSKQGCLAGTGHCTTRPFPPPWPALPSSGPPRAMVRWTRRPTAESRVWSRRRTSSPNGRKRISVPPSSIRPLRSTWPPVSRGRHSTRWGMEPWSVGPPGPPKAASPPRRDRPTDLPKVRCHPSQKWWPLPPRKPLQGIQTLAKGILPLPPWITPRQPRKSRFPC
mmetsp:Transcript_90468/g.156739  ORF Transcript_90468/g.156739 Transcript_90468/m.156739 type:complete len:204 (+) Transcript_90468:5420-6031(+)